MGHRPTLPLLALGWDDPTSLYELRRAGRGNSTPNIDHSTSNVECGILAGRDAFLMLDSGSLLRTRLQRAGKSGMTETRSVIISRNGQGCRGLLRRPRNDGGRCMR
ncbi:MAG TPA: hypothetical protein HPP87_13760 [Planctomycetes bacterium]|nr:hypothetical protein [Planctomycetota bacterium]